MKHIGIVGARLFSDRQEVEDLVMSLPIDTEVVTSGCKGVCQWANNKAKERGMTVHVYSPDLSNIRSNFDIPKRYYKRNMELIEACDFVHAFISKKGGFSGGTRFEIEYAAKLNIPVMVHYEQGAIEMFWQLCFPFMGHSDDYFTTDWQGFFASAVG